MSRLEEYQKSELPEALSLLFPTGDPMPFTDGPFLGQLRSLTTDTQIEVGEYFSTLQNILASLRSSLGENETAVDAIHDFLAPYVDDDAERLSEDGLATVALVFRDSKTIESLAQFSRTLTIWNRVLPQYHQLLTSESPREIELVEVQNGSIDLLVNLNVDIALDLAELFRIGLSVFGGYLTYKKLAHKIEGTYFGNKGLIEGEKEREAQMLSNIGEAVKSKVLEQHKAALKIDKKIDKTSVSKKIAQVADIVTAHIVRGNDLKLIGLPVSKEGEGEQEPVGAGTKDQLAQASAEVRGQLADLGPEVLAPLLEEYKVDEDDKD